MSMRIKKLHPALKHAGYSATTILPGEDPAEFAKLHRALIDEWTPNGALEDDIVATMARAQWRKKNISTFRLAELARQRVMQIRDAMLSGIGEEPATDESIELEKAFIEKCRAAENQASKELGELYALVEMGDEATLDRLMKELEVQERLDAMTDRCIKRLLLVRGLKSMPIGTSAPPKSLPGPSRAA
jgi:hypothetical protein